MNVKHSLVPFYVNLFRPVFQTHNSLPQRCWRRASCSASNPSALRRPAAPYREPSPASIFSPRRCRLGCAASVQRHSLIGSDGSPGHPQRGSLDPAANFVGVGTDSTKIRRSVLAWSLRIRPFGFRLCRRCPRVAKDRPSAGRITPGRTPSMRWVSACSAARHAGPSRTSIFNLDAKASGCNRSLRPWRPNSLLLPI